MVMVMVRYGHGCDAYEFVFLNRAFLPAIIQNSECTSLVIIHYVIGWSNSPQRQPVSLGVKCGCTHASTHTHMHTHLAISAGAKAAENTEVAWLKGKRRLWRRRQQIVRCRCWSVHLMSWCVCVCIYCARAWSEILARRVAVQIAD